MPFALPLAAITLMMWIVWSDSVRPRRSSAFLYSVRVLLYLGASALLLWNAYHMRFLTARSTLVLVFVAVAVGVGGAVYFARQITARRSN